MNCHNSVTFSGSFHYAMLDLVSSANQYILSTILNTTELESVSGVDPKI